MHHQGDVGEETVAVLAFGERPGDGPSGYLGLAWPLRLGALDRVDRGAVQRKPRIARRSSPLRASAIEPKTSSPSSKTVSIPEIRGDPSARTVAIVLCR